MTRRGVDDYRPPAPTPMDLLLAGTPLGTALSAADAALEAARQATPRQLAESADRIVLPSKQASVPFVAHSATSKATAERLERSGSADSDRAVTLAYLRSCGASGATDFEIDAHFRAAGRDFTTMRPRRRKLVELGLVVDSGETRTNERGLACTIWRVRESTERQAAA